ncbi:MAG: processive 1,2-diacylglycerol beta-glucosyltransferase [Thermoleophilaceae bacterium]|nr:processive 1,2-diacylglycerol beta-glucosyltransferase [Thermoleophilaceae bacterium]
MRVLIVSADIGEGHDAPARMLMAGIREERPDAEVEIIDGLDAMGWLVARVIRDGTTILFGRFAFMYDVEYWLIVHFPPVRWLAGLLMYLVGGRGLLRAIRRFRPDIVVSTYPGTTDVIGRFRRDGYLRAPACSAITDLAALLYWAHPDVDLHLVTHPESIPEVRSIAPRSRIEWVRGLTSPGCLDPFDKVAARRSFQLPEEGPVVLVSGGGWAVGDLEGATRVSLGVDGATVVCMCGRNEEVRSAIEATFGDEPRVRPIGFTDRMCDLLAAGDVLIHSTAGLTVLEALMRGTSPISYGWGMAHIRINNRAFAEHGLADVAATPAELDAAIRRALANPRAPYLEPAARPTAASAVLDAAAP